VLVFVALFLRMLPFLPEKNQEVGTPSSYMIVVGMRKLIWREMRDWLQRK